LDHLSWLIRPGRVALMLACAAVLVRCCLFLHQYTPEKSLVPDSSGFERPALSFLEARRFIEASEIQEFFGKLYGSAPSTEPRPMFLRTPGYPLFIAAVYRLGADRRGLVIVQILLSGLAVWLTYVLGTELFSAWAGVLAALLIALDPATVWCAQVVLPDTLFSVLLIAAVLLGIALLRKPAWRRAIYLGTILGIAILFKPVAYYLTIPICAVLLFGCGRKRILAGVLAPLLLLVGGWQVRNLETVGTGTFSGAQSTDLLLWRAAGVVAQQQGIDLESAQKQVIHMIPNATQLSAPELDRAFLRAGAEVIRSHPILYLRDMVKGLIVVFISPGAKLLPAYFGLPSIPFIAGYILFLLLIYSASLVQVAVMWGKGKVATPVLVVVVALYLVVVQAGADSGCRYRVPALPFLAVYAAAGILWVCHRRGGASHQFTAGRSSQGMLDKLFRR
jgi:4-amino-4-deoxy-L-arabinose transferase-like glycosyltransferase